MTTRLQNGAFITAILAALIGALLSGCAIINNWIHPTPAPAPVPQPTNNPTPPAPQPSAHFRGNLFFDATLTPSTPPLAWATSAMDYRAIHGQSNEGQKRREYFNAVHTMGGNALIYIRGNWQRGNVVLDMILNGRKSNVDGHYFTPGDDGEHDMALWAAQSLGVTRHLCFIWNDDNSVPITEAVVKEAVDSYDGTRLGMENIAFGTCLEMSEIATPQQGAAALGWIHKYAPTSMAVCGAQNVDWLIAVAKLAPAGCFYWIEQDGHPVYAPITQSNYQTALRAKLDKMAAVVGKPCVISGEHGGKTLADRVWVTKQDEAAGYLEGAGDWR